MNTLHMTVVPVCQLFSSTDRFIFIRTPYPSTVKWIKGIDAAWLRSCKTEDEEEKIVNLVPSSEDIALYFVKIGGLKMLRDSFDHNAQGLKTLVALLAINEKIREEYQKEGGYVKLIDFLVAKSSKGKEQSFLDSEVVKKSYGKPKL